MANKIEAQNSAANLTNRGRGRPKGSPNKVNAILKHTLLLAAHYAGEKVAVQEELDRIAALKTEADAEGRQLTPKEMKPDPKLIENNGLLTYLVDLAVRSPASYASLLGKVIHVQQADEERGAGVGSDLVINIEIGFIDHTPYKVIEHA